ncbi:MAG TPA: pilus assembly protein PilP [Anaeromyxobacteraceae bacterium]|nr:pilus assembly protein PilP [Anaeromyxobacteraceae bacterium]
MSRRLLSAVLLAALVAACGDSKPAAPAAAPAAAPKAAAPAAPAPAPAPEAEVAYSSVGKRDPFKSFLAGLRATTGAVVTRCSTPLGRFELDQLRLVAVITGLADPMAMVEAPNGVGYSVRKGACIGKNGGVVTTIRTGEVIVTEWAMRADGTREKTETALRLPKEQSLNLEE